MKTQKNIYIYSSPIHLAFANRKTEKQKFLQKNLLEQMNQQKISFFPHLLYPPITAHHRVHNPNSTLCIHNIKERRRRPIYFVRNQNKVCQCVYTVEKINDDWTKKGLVKFEIVELSMMKYHRNRNRIGRSMWNNPI